MYAGKYRRKTSKKKKEEEQVILRQPVAHGRIFTYRECVKFANDYNHGIGDWMDYYCFVTGDGSAELNGMERCMCLALGTSGIGKLGKGVYKICIGDANAYGARFIQVDCQSGKLNIMGFVFNNDGGLDIDGYSFDRDPVQAGRAIWTGSVVRIFVEYNDRIYKCDEAGIRAWAVVYHNKG